MENQHLRVTGELWKCVAIITCTKWSHQIQASSDCELFCLFGASADDLRKLPCNSNKNQFLESVTLVWPRLYNSCLWLFIKLVCHEDDIILFSLSEKLGGLKTHTCTVLP